MSPHPPLKRACIIADNAYVLEGRPLPIDILLTTRYASADNLETARATTRIDIPKRPDSSRRVTCTGPQPSKCIANEARTSRSSGERPAILTRNRRKKDILNTVFVSIRYPIQKLIVMQ